MTIYSASNYAGLEAGKYKAYYGYEQIWKNPNDPDGEQWAFVLWINNVEKMRIPTSQLDDIANMGEPKDYLLAGIALFLSRK